MRFLLYPFSCIYGIIIGIRNFLFDYYIFKSKEFKIPVISIGNITVGGTGKTPHTEYLIELLRGKYNVAVLSRGYKRKTKSFMEVQNQLSAQQVGDEPLQMKVKFPDVNVYVDSNRVNGISKIISKGEHNTSVILLDDAFQHRYVKPGISILLVDYNRIIMNDRLLPYGRLREPAYQKKRADIIVVTKCPKEVTPIQRRILYKDFKLYAYQDLFFSSMQYMNLKHISDDTIIELNSNKLKNTSVLLVTGIANSKNLVDFLKTKVRSVKHEKFPDHYQYKKADIEKLIVKFEKIQETDKIILTTEKDAIRFLHTKHFNKFAAYPVFYIPIAVKFLDNDANAFNKVIERYVAKNKIK